MLFRTGHANLRANKFEGREARCQLCDLKEEESEAHVLLRCRRFDPQRADLIHDLKQAWSGDIDKTAATLSCEQSAIDRRSERAVDTAIKKMLTQVEEIRVQAGAGGLGGYGGDGLAGGSSSSSDEEDLDEELIRMGEEVLESGSDPSDVESP